MDREKILDHYSVEKADISDLEDGGFKLVFKEGGTAVVVAYYATVVDCVDFSEEDSLMHWVNILKREWSDDEG